MCSAGRGINLLTIYFYIIFCKKTEINSKIYFKTSNRSMCATARIKKNAIIVPTKMRAYAYKGVYLTSEESDR